jgi:RHS repeat-associated protein
MYSSTYLNWFRRLLIPRRSRRRAGRSAAQRQLRARTWFPSAVLSAAGGSLTEGVAGGRVQPKSVRRGGSLALVGPVSGWLVVRVAVACVAVALAALLPGVAEAGVSDRGAYQTSIGVQVPEFHEITPVIRLVYDSNAGNGPLGLGWSLRAGSEITRTSKLRGVPNFDASDQLWLDGMELLPCSVAPQSVSCLSGGTHTTRVEGFTRIALDSATNTWTVWRRDGTRYVYEPRFRDVSSATDTLLWTLAKVVDTHGNQVSFDYVCGAELVCYVSDIRYGDGKLCKPCQRGGPDGPILPAGTPLPGVDVHFYWEARPDPVSVAAGGAMQETDRRLRSVDVHEGARRVRVYQVNYAADPANAVGYALRRSWVDSIQLFGSDAVVDAAGNVTSGTALPANRFEAPAFEQLPDASFANTLSGNSDFRPRGSSQTSLQQVYPTRIVRGLPESSILVPSFHPGQPVVVASQIPGHTWGDFDGDHKLDFLQWSVDSDCKQLLTRVVLARSSSTSPGVSGPALNLPNSKGCESVMLPTDIDGDGRTDVLFLRYRRNDPFDPNDASWDAEAIAALSNGDGTFTLGPTTVLWISQDKPTLAGNEEAIRSSRCGVGDFNGDGRGDLACTVKQGGQWLVYEAVSTGLGHFGVRVDYQANDLTDAHMLTIADVNGDGLSDLVVVDNYSRARQQGELLKIKVGVSLGWPFLWRSQATSAVAADSTQTAHILTGDFNDDGRADVGVVIVNANASGGSITTFTSNAGASRDFVVKSSSISGEMPVVSVGDMNGDGLDDLVFAVHEQAGKCSQSDAAGLAISFADRSSGFTIPSMFNTCYEDTGMPWVGDWVHDPFAAQVNGDDIADLVTSYPADVVGPQGVMFVFVLIDRPSQYVPEDIQRWRSADINGDGVPDWVFLNFANPGLIVDSVITQSDGTRRRVPQTILPGGGSKPDLNRVDLLSNVMLADVGGGLDGAPDGKVDIVVTDDATQQIVTLLSNGDGTWRKHVSDYGFTPQGTAFVPHTVLRGHSSAAASGGGWHAIDVSGDGRADLVDLEWRDDGSGVRYVEVTTLRSLGDGTWAIPIPGDYDFGGSLRDPNVRGFRPADINADGRMDLVEVQSNSSAPLGHNAYVFSLIYEGGGTWDDVAAPVTLPSEAAARWQPTEINGDGRTDLASIGSSAGQPLTVSSLLSLGDGDWQPVGNARPTPTVGFDTEAAADFRLADMDGDGKQDIVRITHTASSQAAVTIIWNRYPTFVQTTTLSLPISGDDTLAWQLDDLNAGGHPELVHIQQTLADDLDVIALPVPESSMTLASNGMGARDEISYRSLSEPSRQMPLGALPHVVETVGSRVVGTGNYAVLRTYAFSHATYSYRQRRFLGFTHVEDNDGQRTLAADLELTDACGARRSSEKLLDPNGRLIRETNYIFASTLVPGGPATPTPGSPVDYALCRVDTVRRQEWEGSAKPRISEDRSRYDRFGNVAELIQTGDLADPGDDRKFDSHVYPNVRDFIVDRVAMDSVSGLVSGNWKVLAETEYEYDHSGDYTVPPGPLGELTRVRRATDVPNHFADTTYDYDLRGNLTTTTGPPTPSNPSGLKVTTQYDCEFARFPISVCDPLHCTTVVWDKRFGEVASITDPNGSTTSISYDPLGRTTQRTYPDGSRDRWLWPSDTQWNTPSQAVTHEVDDGSPGDGVLWDVTHFDGLGRPTSLTFEGGIFAEVLAYDGLSNRVVSESAPHFASQAPAITTRFYDAAGRLVTTVNPDSSRTQIVYHVGTQTLTDELGRATGYDIDAFGRITAVHENRRDCFSENCPIIETATTRYRYDALDRLVNIIDSERHKTAIVWDMLGRRKSVCDPDRGCTRFSWNDDGTLASQTDANGVRRTLTYDLVARPIGQLSFDKLNRRMRALRWTWDVDPNTGVPNGASRGQITQLDDVSAAATLQSDYHYDVMGRVDLDTECIDGSCFQMGASFDPAGRVSQLTYPDRGGQVTSSSPAVDYVYGENGMLESIPGFVDQFRHDAAGNTTGISFHNGITETWSFDAKRGWSNGVTVASGQPGIRRSAPPLFQQTLVHNLDGSVREQTIADAQRKYRDVYTHDDWGRLTDVVSSDHSRNAKFRYDPIGNLRQSSSLGLVFYKDPKHVHAPTSTSHGGQYRYDTAGQMIRSNTTHITWNDDGYPTLISTTQAQIQFAYDLAGNRVKTGTQAGVVLQPFPQVEVDPSGGLTYSIFAEGRRLVRFTDPADADFLHADVFGSTRLVTDSTGAPLDLTDYGVTGAARAITQTSTNPYHFTGAQSDSTTGLTYLGTRAYDPRLVHFISADSVIPNLYDPQTLNRYAYARDDPASLSDPSGRAPCDQAEECSPTDYGSICLCFEQSGPPSSPDEWENPWDEAAQSTEALSAPPLVSATDDGQFTRDPIAGTAGPVDTSSCCSQITSCCAAAPSPPPGRPDLWMLDNRLNAVAHWDVGYGKVEVELNSRLEKIAQTMATHAVANTIAKGMGSRAGAGGRAPWADRVKLRVATKEAIKGAAPKTASGDFIDPNTGKVIPKEGPFNYGHKPGFEWWRTQERAQAEGWTREEIIEYENDPTHYQIEDPLSNQSHAYEMP